MQKNRKMTTEQAKARGKKIWATRREHEKNRGVCKQWLDRAEERLLSDDFLTIRHGFFCLNIAYLTFFQYTEEEAISLVVNSGYLQDTEKQRKANGKALLFLLEIRPFSKTLDKYLDATELAEVRAEIPAWKKEVASRLGEITE